MVPTALERRRLGDLDGPESAGVHVAVGGFGPVAAAAISAEHLAALRPSHVFLLGIAGTFVPERHPVGSALTFGRVAIEGVGAGEGAALQGPRALGLPQCAANPEGNAEPIHDELPLHQSTPGVEALLLTVCAASDSPAMAEVRRARHPDAVAEDMEGFAVALACARAGVPLTVVRGISNVVGERDPRAWQISPALAAARTLWHEILADMQRSAAP